MKLLVFGMLAATSLVLLLVGCPEKKQEISERRTYVTPPTHEVQENKDVKLDLSRAISGTTAYMEGEVPDYFDLEVFIHKSAKDAWKLTEDQYFGVQEKWHESAILLNSEDSAEVKAGGALRDEVNTEIDKSVFAVNETVESLFLEAIEAEPDNPYNMATYAMYLQPRKRTVNEVPTQTEPEALEMMDRAIELAPDKYILYLLKIHLMTSPHICHDWIRHYPEEDFILVSRIPEIRRLFDKAGGLEPENGYINYYKALLLNRLAPYVPGYNEDMASSGQTVEGPTAEELLREIRAGNSKDDQYFFFPPPLQPREMYYRVPVLTAKVNFAVYIDHWNQYSMHDTQDVDSLMMELAAGLSWPEDKDAVGELMVMLYQLGRTQPFDRTFFGLQLKLLQKFHNEAEKGSDESLKLAEAIRYLNDQYQSLGNKLYDMRMIKDIKKVGVIGIHETEVNNSHLVTMAREYQGRQHAYLKRAREILGLSYNLFDPPIA